MMLMLTLDDAIKVTQRLVEDAMNDEDIIHQELEQKCWLPSDSEPAKRLYDLVCDINPAEICAQIEAGNLKNWCETIQVEMNLAMVRLSSAQPEQKKGKWIAKSTNGEMFDVCSVCGYVEWDEPHNFCPNCGADMRGDMDD